MGKRCNPQNKTRIVMEFFTTYIYCRTVSQTQRVAGHFPRLEGHVPAWRQASPPEQGRRGQKPHKVGGESQTHNRRDHRSQRHLKRNLGESKAMRIPPRPAFGSLKCASSRFSADSLRQRRGGGRRGMAPQWGPCIQARLKAGYCGADPRGTGAGWIQQKSADAAPGQPDPHDGTRRPSARPGVTPALRRWGTVSLSF